MVRLTITMAPHQVMTNYFMVITYYPALVVVWERYVRGRCCTCCALCGCNATDNASHGTSEVHDNDIAPVTNLKPTDDVVPNITDYRWMERKLHSSFAPWLHHHHKLVCGGFAALMVVCAVFASQVEVSQEATQWVRVFRQWAYKCCMHA